MRLGVLGVGHGHDHGKGGAVGRSGEPLMAVDDVLVALASRCGAHPHGVGAGVLRFGHGEATADLPGGERAQPARLLLRRAVGVQQLHVADVRRRTVEGVVAQRAAAQRLAHLGKVAQRQPHAAEVGRQVRRPQPEGLHLLAQRLQPRFDGVEALLQQQRLERVELLADKGIDGVEVVHRTDLQLSN